MMIKCGTPAKISSEISTPKQEKEKVKKTKVAVSGCFISSKIVHFYLFENKSLITFITDKTMGFFMILRIKIMKGELHRSEVENVDIDQLGFKNSLSAGIICLETSGPL